MKYKAPYRTVWSNPKYDANEYGSKLVNSIITTKFPFPKSINTVLECLKAVDKKHSMIFLDFFAGSGTTGHAVLELNQKDGGNRKFILCTNNENKICNPEEVTYPRIQKVIKGYKKNGDGDWIDELGGNLQYFKTALIKKDRDKEQVKFDLTERCTEMLCVKENIFNLTKEDDDFKIFESNKKDRFLCIYYNIIDDSFKDFLEALKSLKGSKAIYMFSLNDDVDKTLFKDIQNKRFEPIPQKILDVYENLVKMNISEKTEHIDSLIEEAEELIHNNKQDDTTRTLRTALEKILENIARKKGISIFTSKGKEKSRNVLNDDLKDILTPDDRAFNNAFCSMGNQATHRRNEEPMTEYSVEHFLKHVKNLRKKYL